MDIRVEDAGSALSTSRARWVLLLECFLNQEAWGWKEANPFLPGTTARPLLKSPPPESAAPHPPHIYSLAGAVLHFLNSSFGVLHSFFHPLSPLSSPRTASGHCPPHNPSPDISTGFLGPLCLTLLSLFGAQPRSAILSIHFSSGFTQGAHCPLCNRRPSMFML